jgi:DNA-binding transcriptional LysR family regulator
LVRALQRSAHDHRITVELRQGEFDQVLGAFATSQFDAMIRLQPSSPDPCWVCEAGSVDAALAAAADAQSPGAAAKLEALLRDQGLVLPIWRERPVVALRDGLDGVSANGFSVLGPAWNIENWVWSR